MPQRSLGERPEPIVDPLLPDKINKHARGLGEDAQILVSEFVRRLQSNSRKRGCLNSNPMYVVRTLEDFLYSLRKEHGYADEKVDIARKILKRAVLSGAEGAYKETFACIIRATQDRIPVNLQQV